MTRPGVLVAAAALAVALTTTSALAKGASEATITGPGLGDGITLAGEGQLGGERLMQLAEAAGFFPALFATTPNPMRTARPAGELGPPLHNCLRAAWSRGSARRAAAGSLPLRGAGPGHVREVG
jgi:hypothetical protein